MENHDFGVVKVTTSIDEDGSAIASVTSYKNGETLQTLKQYTVSIKVDGDEDAMKEISSFLKDLTKRRQENNLYHTKFDSTTRPTVQLQFPTKNLDGKYILLLSWMEK